MLTVEEYTSLDAIGLAELVRAGEAQAAEMAACAEQRHRDTDAAINAIVEWYADPVPGTGDGPLMGVPTLRKDYGSAERGRLVEMGSRLARGVVAERTSPFFTRLASAGASVRGRTAVPEFIQHGTTESVLSGVTRNPWDPSLSAGGSSGGAAAAVAAGVVPFAHASDCAGSIRIPAAACGLFGLKPGRRRIPWPGGGWGGIAEEFVVTRSARDARLLFDVLADGPSLPRRQRLRVAVSVDHWAGASRDADVVTATLRVAEVLAAQGHHVEPIPAPITDARLMETWDALFTRWVAHDVTRVAAATGRPVDATTVEPTTLLAVEAARRLVVSDVTAAQIAQGEIAVDLAGALDRFDVILTPTLGRARIPLDWVGGRVEPFEEYLRRNSELFPYSYLFNVAGWPSLAVPVDPPPGARTPLSVQLSGPIGSEHRLLDLAERIAPGVRPVATAT